MTDSNADNRTMKQPADRNQVAHRHFSLWLVVGGIMALVVAVWALFLPYQMKRERLRSAMGVDRWQTSPAPGNEPSNFGEQMRAIQAKLEAQSEAVSANRNAAPAETPAPPTTDEALRQNLEEKLKAAEATPPANEPPPNPTSTP
ncbi:MAG: hypothetical protein PHT12_02295 [Patescibacteria group bacterium]|nr:hypothetical protein [Patescibacteria group bacterium]